MPLRTITENIKHIIIVVKTLNIYTYENNKLLVLKVHTQSVVEVERSGHEPVFGNLY